MDQANTTGDSTPQTGAAGGNGNGAQNGAGHEPTIPVNIGSGQTATKGSILDLDLSGRQLGDYRLLRRLGRGAMADVYLAEQGSLRRQVAFKVLKRELAADDSYVRRFHMEAQSAAALVQANIVQIYEVGDIAGWHYIAQEYVEGQNVAQYLARHGSVDVKLALAIIRQVTAALCKAAERGIVHRDIKPENIMLAKSGEVKVADFGLARIGARDEESLKLTQVGITMGTPLYMSPEQVEGRTLDPRSDLYSLGVTCYHMLSGNPPFRGETALSVALQHVRTQPERLENIRPDLPAPLCRIVHKLLSKDLAERFQSPRDLLHELRALQMPGVDMQWPAELDEFSHIENVALGQSNWAATQRLQAVMVTQSRMKKNYWWLLAIAGIVLLALVGGAAVAWALRGPFILDVPESALPKVVPGRDALSQFEYAEYRGDEAGWLSVIEYFPDDPLYVPLAKEQLGLLYLNALDKASLAKSIAVFEQLANDYPKTEPQYRAFGLAGQAIALSLDNRPKDSMTKFLELDAMLNGHWDTADGARFLNDQMRQMLRSAVRRNSKTIGEENTSQIQRRLDGLDEPAPAEKGTSTQKD